MNARPEMPPNINVAGTKLPKIARAKGSYLWDADGKQYIDGSGGPAVYCIGHSNEEVNAAITNQLQQIAHGYRYNFTSDALEELTEIVAERCGGTLRHMVFVTGGSEAVEILSQGGVAVSCRPWRDEPPPLHRARTLLARQHAGRPFRLGLS